MNRRTALKFLAALFSLFLWPPEKSVNAVRRPYEHPFHDPPEYTEHRRCANCGMDRNKWARTRQTFRSAEGEFHTCSIHCVAVLAMKLGTEVRDARSAEYFHPGNMLEADAAVYLIGSSAPGTMTGTSKIAFSSKDDADVFAKEHGGRTGGFEQAMKEAAEEIQQHMKPRN